MTKCEICGQELKNQPYWKTKCYSCWKKTELKGNKKISDIMGRLGENSTSGKKRWQELQRQQEAQYKNYKGEK